MNNIYQIEGAKHRMHNGQLFLKDQTHFPEFLDKLSDFKKMIIDLVDKNENKTFVHFGDGDYFFLKKQSVGSASPGRRALSISYKNFNIEPFLTGWLKNDYYCVEYLEKNNRSMLSELYPNIDTIPTEYLYGLTMNRWFFRQFKGKIGLIGASNKLEIIKKLMEHEEYINYLGLDKFNDYISIPQKFACDNLENTINMVKTQLENSDPNTRIYLFGVGHVKSGLIHNLKKYKKAVYLDIGAGIDGLAGIIDPDRPYALGWNNYRMTEYNYNDVDLLCYDKNKDKKLKLI